MDVAHLHELVRLEQSYWWHAAKREVVRAALLRWCPPPGRLIEGGVGGGGNLLAWREMGYTVSGFDVSSEAVCRCRGDLSLDVVRHDLQEPWPIAPGTADVVVMLDVLEHLERPAVGLRYAAEALTPQGNLILTVPAIGSLMGPWDRMLGHHRRYTPRLLRKHAVEAGLRMKWLSYWNSFCLPVAYPVRRWQRARGRGHSPEFPQVSATMNRLLGVLAAGERRLMGISRIPIGLSMIGVLVR